LKHKKIIVVKGLRECSGWCIIYHNTNFLDVHSNLDGIKWFNSAREAIAYYKKYHNKYVKFKAVDDYLNSDLYKQTRGWLLKN